MKLNTLLGKTDTLSAQFKGAMKDYFNFFKNSQGAFKGEKKTYEASPDKVDIPANRINKQVQTTVKEKLDYFVKHNTEYIDAVMTQELTNSSGVAKATLIVAGEEWGEFTSLELLRLKSLIDSQEFRIMHENIPVRSDDTIWKATTAEEYIDREIFENELFSYEERTTDKDSYILPDPNVQYLKDTAKYQPQVAQKNTVVIVGKGTRQVFTGEWSQRQKAKVLERIAALKLAVTIALKQCNEVDVVESKLTGDKIFSYLYK